MKLMKKMISFLFAAFTTVNPVNAAAVQIFLGDILLQPLKCHTCSLIEAEENTIYSHIGIVIKTHPEVLVAEAYESVQAVSLNQFQKKTEPGQNIKILRFRNSGINSALTKDEARNWNIFLKDFNDHGYDRQFLWNNFDPKGRELFYCSELVSKLLQAFLQIETPIKRMHFQQNREAWIKFFKGQPPDGQWGNSPADFHQSELFYDAGELKKGNG
jgi:hypothetical protein